VERLLVELAKVVFVSPLLLRGTTSSGESGDVARKSDEDGETVVLRLSSSNVPSTTACILPSST